MEAHSCTGRMQLYTVIIKSPRVHSGPLYKGYRTSDPQRNVMGLSTDVTTCFYAFLDIPKFPNVLWKF